MVPMTIPMMLNSPRTRGSSGPVEEDGWSLASAGFMEPL